MRATVYRQTIERTVRGWKELMDEGRPFVLELKRFYKARTTGQKSQNHHINGHTQQLCMITGNDFNTMKTFLKLGAIEQGYPFDTIIDPTVDPEAEQAIRKEPWSETRIDTLQAGYLIDYIHQFADENGYKLIEGDW
jgi:hypothetical protein